MRGGPVGGVDVRGWVRGCSVGVQVGAEYGDEEEGAEDEEQEEAEVTVAGDGRGGGVPRDAAVLLRLTEGEDSGSRLLRSLSFSAFSAVAIGTHLPLIRHVVRGDLQCLPTHL